MDLQILNDTLSRCEKKMRFQHKALATRKSYLSIIRKYYVWLQAARPVGDSTAKIEQYLTARAEVDKISASTQNVEFNAIRYLYVDVLGIELGNINALRCKVPKHERHAPTREEVAAVLGKLQDRNGFPVRLVFKLLYGCGLRVSEPLNLRIKDIRFERGELVIRGSKGAKDRVVSIPPSLLGELRHQMSVAELMWQKDHRDRQPCQIPGAYRRKAPSSAFEFGWYFLFPGKVPVPHPDTGELVRFHFHPANVQRAVFDACKAAKVAARFTPHHLRHAYATHSLEAGFNIHDVKEVLGHKNVETTMVYLHPEASRVHSPLEVLTGVV